MDKTILIEKTSKHLKRWELIVTTALFLTLLAGFGSRPGAGMTASAIVSIYSAIAHLSASDYQKLNDLEYETKKGKNSSRR